MRSWFGFVSCMLAVAVGMVEGASSPFSLTEEQEQLWYALSQTWTGMVERNKEWSPSPSVFLIHRPYSETPRDAVSEGVGYGLLLSLYLDDQVHFDELCDGAETTMWNGRYYDWRVDEFHQKTGLGAATDAEQDIALSLLFAHRKCRTQVWACDRGREAWYLSRAQQILRQFWVSGIDDGIVRPGYDWGGSAFVNVGYFAPAWYRIFQQYDPDPTHDWSRVIDRCYEILYHSVGIDKGLVPDWMTPQGEDTTSIGYNAYGDGRYLYKDAIRTYWRIATDALWFDEKRALPFLTHAFDFLTSQGGITRANFFQMNGELVPASDLWVFDGGKKTRPRREHSPLTIGMWSYPMGMMGNHTACIHELLTFYEPNATYWGKTTGDETVEQNEMYFEQFLASFGALYLTQQWVQVSPPAS